MVQVEDNKKQTICPDALCFRQKLYRKYASGQSEMARMLDKGVYKTAVFIPVYVKEGWTTFAKSITAALLVCVDTYYSGGYKTLPPL